MSDMISAEEAQKLLDGKIEDIKLAYSNNGEGVIYITPTENRDSAVAIPVRDKNMGWRKANPEVYMALIDRFNVAPDLARTVIALHAQLADAKAAQALVVERAAEECDAEASAAREMRNEFPQHTSVSLETVERWFRNRADAIRALADTDGLAMVQALRAERDDLRAAVEGLIAVLDRNDKKGPIPDVEMMFCWLAAQDVRAAFRKIASKGGRND